MLGQRIWAPYPQEIPGSSTTSLVPMGISPTVVAGPGAGAGAVATLLANSTDWAGILRVFTGLGTLANAVVATVTFTTPQPIPRAVLFSAHNNQTADFISSVFIDFSHFGFTLKSSDTALQNGTFQYEYSYFVVGG